MLLEQIGCLSDALGNGCLEIERLLPPPRPSSALLSDFGRADYDESTGLLRNVRSEAHTPDSPQSMSNELDDELPDTTMLDNITSSSPMVMPEMRKSRARSIQSNGDVGSKRGSLTYRSLERLNRGPNRVSVYGEQAQIQIPHPFRGAQSSQMICTGCGYKSVVRYDKFDSISLPLPEHTNNIGLSLGHLLSEYVASENLNDVTCESCNETCQHTKTVTFAKVTGTRKHENDNRKSFESAFQFYFTVTGMFVHSYFAKHMATKWTTVQATGCCAFSRKSFNGTV